MYGSHKSEPPTYQLHICYHVSHCQLKYMLSAPVFTRYIVINIVLCECKSYNCICKRKKKEVKKERSTRKQRKRENGVRKKMNREKIDVWACTEIIIIWRERRQ